MRLLSKNNGSKLKLGKKEKVGFKTKPRFRLGPKQKGNFLCFISFKKEDSIIKEKITEITYYPIPSYKPKKYLTKHTIVKTQSGSLVKITNLNQGRLLGLL